jgi:ATP-binding cassette subfamily B protein
VNLARAFGPKHGVLTIGGNDYKITPCTPSIPHWRGSRRPSLSGTIRENIRYGRLTAIADEIEEAAKLAGADFIVTFEKGYDRSRRERQPRPRSAKTLISLARAVLAQPEIFIMDEATSSVDTLTEALIQKGMEHLMEGRTSFIIAHRLSTIRKADRILVFDGGRIAEAGSHAELLQAAR